MIKIETSTEKLNITANDTIITFKDEITTIKMDGQDNTDARDPFFIKFEFKNREGEKFSIERKNLDKEKGVKFVIYNANNQLDAGPASPIFFATNSKDSMDGLTKNIYKYFINFWVKKLGESRSINYTVYREKEPSETQALKKDK